MEKKQKIAMKKLKFVTVIALASNFPGVIIRGQYNSPKWELSGGNCPRWELSGGNCPRGQFSGGQLSRGGIVLEPQRRI